MDPLSDDLQENLDRLVVECLENGCVWGLQDTDGNCQKDCNNAAKDGGS